MDTTYRSPLGIPRALPDVRPCLVPNCHRAAEPDAPFHICLEHTRTAFAYYAQHLQDVCAEPVHPAQPVTPRREKVGRVYFIRRGDLIKIGWSENPNRRLSHLAGDALLHDTPGTMRDETLLHRGWEHLLVPGMGREWFYGTDELVGYINALRRWRTDHAA